MCFVIEKLGPLQFVFIANSYILKNTSWGNLLSYILTLLLKFFLNGKHKLYQMIFLYFVHIKSFLSISN